MDNITFDLETLGISHNAPIVQIGAVKFKDDGTITDKFIRNIKITSLKKYNFNIDYDTIQWWFEQEDKAIKSVFCVEDAIDLRLALLNFNEWLGKPSEYIYWSHKDFDPPILNNNLKAVGFNSVIPYKLQKDIRTITHFVNVSEIKHDGIAHNALDDCIFQAAYISKAIRTINEALTNKRPTL
jgi:DNA polymerase III epsilon subunit-like protein